MPISPPVSSADPGATSGARRAGARPPVRGVIRAGGADAPLRPLTLAVPRQLIPVYDKPLIYYPMSVLMLAGIRDVLVLAAPPDLPPLRRLFGDGSRLGMAIHYAAQRSATPDALLAELGRSGSGPVALIDCDTIVQGAGLGALLRRKACGLNGAVVFGGRGGPVPAADPALVGLRFYGPDVFEFAREIPRLPSGFAALDRRLLAEGRAELAVLGRGTAWLAADRPEALAEAGRYVRTLEVRQGIRIACLEEIALRMGFIDQEACRRLGELLGGSSYGEYVVRVAESVPPGTPFSAGQELWAGSAVG